MSQYAWMFAGALLVAACGNGNPPTQAEEGTAPSGGNEASADPPTRPPTSTREVTGTTGSTATAPGGPAPSAPAAGAPAAGVISNDGIAEYDRLTAEQLAPLKLRRVLWGHQSVGENIVNGAKQLGFDFRTVERGSDYGETHWGEAAVAENGDPQRKIRSFVDLMVGGGIGSRVEAASFKFCWVDFEDGTNLDELLDQYDSTMRDMQARFPSVRFLHVTPPLTTDEPELNGLRWRFGRELVRRHRDTGLVFDLAAVISTDARGQQCKSGNQRRLCPGWASDSGHLDDAGSQRAAKAFLYAFYRLLG